MSPSSPRASIFLAFLVVAATLMAGCGKPQATAPLDKVEEALKETSGKVLHGRVLTDEVLPLPEAKVELLDDELNVTTDPEGGYIVAGLESRDYLVKVTSPGYYPEVQRAAMMLGRDFQLDFYLVKMPTGDPQRSTQVFNAFLSCQLVVVTDFPGTMRQDCGAADPNNKRSTTFVFNKHSSGFIVELFWDPTTACASTLDFGLYLVLETGLHALHESTIRPGEKIHIPPAYFAPKETLGGDVRMNLNGDRCDIGTGPGLGAGAVVQQSVDVFFTAFYFETIPPEFTVKNG